MLQLITFRAEVTIYKSLLVQEQWEAGNRLLGKESKWDDFDKYVIIDKTVPRLSTDIRKRSRLQPVIKSSGFSSLSLHS